MEKTPRERLREALEKTSRDLAKLPAWARMPPAFQSQDAEREQQQ